MQDIPLSMQKTMPWKNGLGSTREIFASPQDGKFDWRVSLASVATNGPFSIYENYERHIMVLEGSGMDLQFANGATASLTPLNPYMFSGDEPVEGTLPNGSVTDFNLMVDRDYGRGKLHVLAAQNGQSFACEADHCLIYALAGPKKGSAKLLAKGETCAMAAEVAICEVYQLKL